MANVRRMNMDDVEISESNAIILRDVVKACSNKKKSLVVSIDRIKKYTEKEIMGFIYEMNEHGIISCYTSNGVFVVTGYWDFFLDDLYVPWTPMGSLHKSGGKFYVYICYHNNVPVYIGKGSGDRIKHCTSGKSTCIGLNEIYYRDGVSTLRTEKVLVDLCNMTALAHEKTMIRTMKIAGVKLLNKD